MAKIIIGAFTISLVISWVLNNLALRMAFRWKTLSKFDPVKSKEISRLGGVALFAAFLIPLICFGSRYAAFDFKSWSLIGAMFLIFLLGLRDDIKELNPWAKLVGQIIVISFLIFAGFKTRIVMVSPAVNIVITFLWIIGITNAVNLLDILDGLAGGLAAISSLVFLILAYLTNNIFVAILTACLFGSTLGFLKFNFSSAKIYMGDTGSGFLGFSLAIIAIMLSYATLEHKLALFVPLFVLGLPILDLAFVTFKRLVQKKSIVRKSKDHLVLYLIQQGLSLKKAVFAMYLINILFGISAILLLKVSDFWGIIIFIVTIVSCLGMACNFEKTKAIIK